jgi:sugar phosphate isomerase/epimerase
MLEIGVSFLGFVLDKIIGAKGRGKFLDLLLESMHECFHFAEENNIKVCELLIDYPILSTEENKKAFIEICNSYSIKKQVHAPFIDVNLCSFNESISQASVDCYIETAEICDEIGAELLTIHPGLANEVINSINRYNVRQLVKAVGKLLNSVIELNVKILIENMPKNCHILLTTDDFNEFFSLLPRDDIWITYDTSHFWTSEDDLTTFWREYHNRILNIHLVDNTTRDNDPHIALGSGWIDFDEVFSLIKKYNYSGALIIELSSKKDLKDGIKFVESKLKKK